MSYKEEFRLKNFLLDYNWPQHFVQLQCGSIKGYLGWRVLSCLYHVVWIIITGAYSWQFAGPDPNQQVKWFIYLTDWAYFILTMATLLDCVVVAYVFIARKDIVEGKMTTMTWYLKADWVMFEMSNAANFMITILFWSLIYKGDYPTNAVIIETHALNSVYVILNLFFTRVPVRIYHVFHSMLFALVYVLFSVVYYASGGKNYHDQPYIYPVVDWGGNPEWAAFYSLMALFIGLPVCHLICYAVYVVRLVIYRKCLISKSSSRSEHERDFENIHISAVTSYSNKS
ncbi:hypothetical protein ACJMK2_016716 [Sinanodonta woodiana]|uniref:Protein rolling stone n=1 Tax=Sinanodonta woodiana TaxID=1069815 RepID=A0ABD3UXY8_SINWO